MEAENFLSSGYGTRLALEAKLEGKGRLADCARIWQPSRLKGITVSPEFGTPFLAATQVFDTRPVARKFLSLHRTDTAAERFVSSGDILITCSGSVGRATLATDALKGVLISHDLLRVNPHEEAMAGWVYAYLRSKTVRSMMVAAKYGHIIKHLEPSHLSALPMPRPREEIRDRLFVSATRILADRNRAVALFNEAEHKFGLRVGEPTEKLADEVGFAVRARSMMSGRRRLEGVFHSPTVRRLQAHFAERRFKITSFLEAGFDLWLPTRFRRIPAEEGVELVGSADLFEINPDLEKRIADIDFGDRNGGRVERGWLLLARSGQTYGLNGTLAIANGFHEGKVISDHVIRIAPNERCSARAGYLYTALSHPTLGRPMVKALAYGSSIPEIDPGDIANLPIPRIDDSAENEIAELAEEGARLFADADIVENVMSAEVDRLLEGLLAGDWSNFVTFDRR